MALIRERYGDALDALGREDEEALRRYVSELWGRDWDSPDDGAYDAL